MAFFFGEGSCICIPFVVETSGRSAGNRRRGLAKNLAYNLAALFAMTKSAFIKEITPQELRPPSRPITSNWPHNPKQQPVAHYLVYPVWAIMLNKWNGATHCSPNTDAHILSLIRHIYYYMNSNAPASKKSFVLCANHRRVDTGKNISTR